MAIEIIHGGDAWRIAASNPHARYPTAAKGAERLVPYADPKGRPSFRIARDARVFTIGSCFAREIDTALGDAGINVVSRPRLADGAPIDGEQGLFNKYTVQSMLNEMRWALDPAHPHPGADAFVAVRGDEWMDPQLGGRGRTAPLQEVSALRAAFTRAMRSVADADVFIATLGLAEAWYDTRSGLYLNLPPPMRACQAEPERFQLHVLDYQEILDAVEALHATVRRFGKPGVKFLFTVSPVALLSTFREQDVLVANTYSKAVQRAALEAFVARHDDADYFPSFETVSLTSIGEAWIPSDFRHVNPYLVRRIMGSVFSAYLDEPIALNTPSDEINQRYAAGDMDAVVAQGEAAGTEDLTRTALYRFGLAYKKLGRAEAALAVFRLVADRHPDFQDGSRNALAMAHRLKRPDLVATLLSAHAARFPDDAETLERYRPAAAAP